MISRQRINEQCQQTIRQLAEGDIGTHKAVMRSLKMLTAMTRPTHVAFEAESAELSPSRQGGGSPVWLLKAAESTVLAPGGTTLVSTGVRLAVPPGYEAVVGGAGPGVCDGLSAAVRALGTEFRDTVLVSLHNSRGDSRRIRRGEAIAGLSLRLLDDMQMVPADAATEHLFRTT